MSEQANDRSASHWWREAQRANEALARAEARNSELLERVSSLRVCAVEVMRRCWPAHVSGVEKTLGGRLSSLPDALLLGYLDAFASMTAAGKVVTPNDLAEVRRALRDVGFPLEGNSNAVDMAVAIRAGFKALSSENTRIRNRAKAAGTERTPLEKDLSWAEPQDKQNSEWGITGDTQGAVSPASGPSSARPAGSGRSKSRNRRKNKTSEAQLFPDTGSTGTQPPARKQETTAPSSKSPAHEGADLSDWDVPTRDQGTAPEFTTPNLPGTVDIPDERPAPVEETDSLDLDVVTRIEAALPLPAPRFMQDIVGVAGSAAAASAWEKSQRGQGLVAFINPQPKHRQRGSLLVPKDILRTRTPNFNKSPWGRALSENYPAGRLYELALVLRRLEPNIVAIGFRKHAVEITYRVAGGIAGLVVGLAAGEDPWLHTEECVASLLKIDGLTQIDVVTCPNNSVNAVIASLQTASKAQGWQPRTPLLASGLNEWLTEGSRAGQPISTS